MVEDSGGPAGVGSDVDDDETVDEFRVTQGEHHGDLSTQGMPDQVHGLVVGVDRLGDMGGHGIGEIDVVEVLGPIGLAVIGQVDQQAGEFGRDVLGDAGEVLAPAEQAVEEDDQAPGFADASAVDGGHVFSLSRRSAPGDPTRFALAVTASRHFNETSRNRRGTEESPNSSRVATSL